MLLLVGITPFADIVLLSFNGTTAIIVQVVLALLMLKEAFVVKYDVPGLALIIAGSIMIILTAKFDKAELTPDLIREYLLMPRSILFYVTFVVL